MEFAQGNLCDTERTFGAHCKGGCIGMLDEILFRNLLYINKIRERAYAEGLNQPVSDNLIFVAILSEMEILISFVIEYYALPRCAQILNRSRYPIIPYPGT